MAVTESGRQTPFSTITAHHARVSLSLPCAVAASWDLDVSEAMVMVPRAAA